MDFVAKNVLKTPVFSIFYTFETCFSFKVEACHERQVVAVAATVTPRTVCAQWLHAAVSVVGFEQEGRVVHRARAQAARHGRAYDDVVDAFPPAFVLVCAACSVAARRTGGHVGHALGAQLPYRCAVAALVEVAHYDDHRVLAGGFKRVYGKAEAVGHELAVRPCAPLSAVAARGVDYEYVECVACYYAACGVEYVARGAHAFHRFDAKRIVPYGREAAGRVEQGYVDAANVGRGGHDVLVVGASKQRPPCKVAHHAVVLHLAQGYQVGQPPVAVLCAAVDYGFGRIVQFVPVFVCSPAAVALRGELRVLLQAVVAAVNQVFAVQLDERKQGCQEQRQAQF